MVEVPPTERLTDSTHEAAVVPDNAHPIDTAATAVVPWTTAVDVVDRRYVEGPSVSVKTYGRIVSF